MVKLSGARPGRGIRGIHGFYRGILVPQLPRKDKGDNAMCFDIAPIFSRQAVLMHG